jgi:hypothetical protein
MEATNPNSASSLEYLPAKNQKGETIYVRETPRPTHPAHPIIYPSPIVNPQTDLPKPTALNLVNPNSATQISDSSSKGVNGFLELSRTTGNTHFGIHFAAPMNEFIIGRLGASFFNSEELFAGLDLSARAYLPVFKVRPFAGAGAYYGDTKKCSDEINNGVVIERCEKKFLGAGYVELGVEYNAFSFFWRDYSINRAGLSVPTNGFWGIGLQF